MQEPNSPPDVLGRAPEETSLGHIDTFITECEQAQDLDGIFASLRKQIDRLGFERLSYQLILPPNGPRRSLYITSYPPEWTEHYIQKNYISQDIVGLHSLQVTRPFMWSDVRNRRNLTKVQKLLFYEADDLDLTVGGTVPIHGPGATRATFSVSSSLQDTEFDKLFVSKRHELQLLATYAHECILKIGLQDAPQPQIALTPSEVEVLTWTSRGKSAWDISVILSLSEATVKFHLQSACRKLKASNKTHATVIALMHGIIVP